LGVARTIRKKKIFSYKLDRETISKLPYFGPVSRRLYIISQNKKGETTDEIFVQRREAFTTDLVSAIRRLTNHEIAEIRYSCGLDSFVRIFLDENGNPIGEFICESQNVFKCFKEKLRPTTDDIR
jgi:hypothetical protein